VSGSDSHERYTFAGFQLEPSRRLLIDAQGSPVKLTAKAFDALVYLVEHAGELVHRSNLVETLWPRTVVEDNNLNQAIAALRRAIGSSHVVTVAGRGYQFVTPVRVEPVEDGTSPGASPAAVPSVLPTTPQERRRSLFVRALAIGAALLATGAIGAFGFAHRSGTEGGGLGEVVRIEPVTTYLGDEGTPELSRDGSRVAFSWDTRQGHSDIYVQQVSTGAPLALTRADDGLDSNPVWSPDGERIAFLRHFDRSRFDIVVVPALGGPERTVTSALAYWISVDGYPMLAWTPDGKALLFTAQVQAPKDGQGYAFHLLDLDSGAVRLWPLVRGPKDYDTSPAFSHDGRRLAFTRYRLGERLPTLMVQALGSGYVPEGRPTPLPGVGPAMVHSLAWSADGERLHFMDEGQIKEWRIGGGVRVVYTLPPSMAGSKTVSLGAHDGKPRAVAVNRPTDVDIWVLPLDPSTHAAAGQPHARAKSTSIERHPRFSPDGRMLAFISNRSGKTALWVANADGSSPRQLSDLDAFVTGYPRWSPDSKRIAFHASAPNHERQVYTVNVDEGRPALLASGCCPGSWSADGRYVYSMDVGTVDYLLRIRVADGVRERLFEGDSAIESANGAELLYSKSSERGVFARSLAGVVTDNPEERLVDDYVPSLGGIAPVSDGFFYLGCGTDGRPRAFRFFDYAAGAARDVAPAPRSTSFGLTVAPNGRELLYSADALESGGDLVLLEFASGSP
jgi:Tol biopolymer transport system component/DNA-binding winged helix-turn-helix (wHTH) protein